MQWSCIEIVHWDRALWSCTDRSATELLNFSLDIKLIWQYRIVEAFWLITLEHFDSPIWIGDELSICVVAKCAFLVEDHGWQSSRKPNSCKFAVKSAASLPKMVGFRISIQEVCKSLGDGVGSQMKMSDSQPRFERVSWQWISWH